MASPVYVLFSRLVVNQASWMHFMLRNSMLMCHISMELQDALRMLARQEGIEVSVVVGSARNTEPP